MRTIAPRLVFALLVAACCSAGAAEPPAPAAPASDSRRLAELYRADQADRQPPIDGIDWAAVSRRDRERRIEVLERLAGGGVRTANDYYHAAMIFQHGETDDEIRLAYSLARIAVALDPAQERARWLSAAAWDRILMRRGLPQWYGTQFTRPTPEVPWRLHPVEPAITDDERAALGVPPLAAARGRVTELNAGAPPPEPAPCATSAAREFDFWIGEWTIRQRILGADGGWHELDARTSVEPTLDGCALVEHWRGDVQLFWQGMEGPEPMAGLSVRAFDPASGRWAIHWMDTRTPSFGAPYVGGFEDGRGVFYRDWTTPAGERRGRITFSRIDADTVDWELALSSDGGESWTVLWTMAMRRAGS